MTPAEKAKELVEKFKTYSYYDGHDMTTRRQRERSNVDSAKECAEICVDEMIIQLDSFCNYWDLKNGDWYKDELSKLKKVKELINKL